MALGLDALSLGLLADDFAHRTAILARSSSSGGASSWWEIYGARLSPADVEALVQMGLAPWWTHSHYSTAALRPLAAATHYLDYWAWSDRADFMHAHSLLWYGALVVVAGTLYRRFVGAGWTAALATVLYAVDEAHIGGAAWLAGRNTVMTAFFAALTLLLHHRHRCDGWRLAGWLAPATLALSLASSEGGLATWGFLFAHALFVDQARWSRRARALAPMLALTLSWLSIHRVMGYGVRHSGAYLDPIGDPIGFLSHLPGRLGAQCLDLLTLPALDAVDTSWRIGLALAAGGVLLAAACKRRRIAFWLAGSALSSLPFCMVYPEIRLTFIPSLGVAASCAELSRMLVERPGAWRGALPRSIAGLVAAGLLVVHGPVAAALATTMPQRLGALDEDAERIIASWPELPAGEPVVVLNTWSYLMLLLTAVERAGAGRPFTPIVAGASQRVVYVTRIDAGTLELRTQGGYLREPGSLLVRSPREPFTPGYRVVQRALTFEVITTTRGGRPDRVRIRASPTVLTSVQWVCWRGPGLGYETLALPEIGQTKLLMPARWRGRAQSPD